MKGNRQLGANIKQRSWEIYKSIDQALEDLENYEMCGINVKT